MQKDQEMGLVRLRGQCLEGAKKDGFTFGHLEREYVKCLDHSGLCLGSSCLPSQRKSLEKYPNLCGPEGAG